MHAKHVQNTNIWIVLNERGKSSEIYLWVEVYILWTEIAHMPIWSVSLVLNLFSLYFPGNGVKS